ncbi:MAG: thioesterase family protein [Pseudomonadota bacterium]
MHFRFLQKVLFKHCDPAGIVFYPRYFEMLNDAVEAMFSDLLDYPFEGMHPEAGVPTAQIEIRFTAPSRHGDALALDVTIGRIGGSSLGLETRAICADETRFEARHTLVHVGATGRPARWPDPLRARVEDLLEGAA